MSRATLNTDVEYVGNGVTNSFPITFEFVDIATIKPTVDDIIVGFSFDNALAPTAVIFDVVPANLADILIQRVSVKNQELNLDASQSFSSQAENIEAQLDRMVDQIQEVEAGATITTTINTGGAVFYEWEISTAYLENQLLRDGPAGRYYIVDADYTSNAVNIEADITANKLELFNEGEQGEQGIQGIQGLTGAAGSNGSNGSNGAAGADGIFVAIANQPEAEAGTDNVKGMTPLRVQQSIDDDLTAYTTTVVIDAKDASQDLEISRLKQRATTIEANLEINQFDGKQRVKNNEAVAEALLGRDADTAELGYGDQCWLNANGAEFARINLLVKRVDSLEDRFVNVTLVMHYISGVWYVGRESTVVLNDGEPDGLIFTVVTDGVVGTIHYTSDNMLGTGYEGEITWQGKEIPATTDGLVD